MKRAKVVLLVVVVLAVVAVLVKAMEPGRATKPQPVAVAPQALSLQQQQADAEERLLDEQAFSHPVDVPAPDVEVVTPEGKRVRLSALRGKVVLVNFWATWCPPCVAEMPSLLELGRALTKAHPDGFQMVAVSNDDSWKAVNTYFAKYFGGIPKQLDVVRDPDASAARAYYCAARGYCPDIKFPETYVVGRTGRIVAMMVGPRDWSDPGARQLLDFIIGG